MYIENSMAVIQNKEKLLIETVIEKMESYTMLS
jgi:hypothetical protein